MQTIVGVACGVLCFLLYERSNILNLMFFNANTNEVAGSPNILQGTEVSSSVSGGDPKQRRKMLEIGLLSENDDGSGAYPQPPTPERFPAGGGVKASGGGVGGVPMRKGDAMVTAPQPLGPADCEALRTKYDVVPGYSWGRLTVDLQRRWSTFECDRYVHASTATALIPSKSSSSPSSPVSPGGEDEFAEDRGVAEHQISDWCTKTRDQFGVVPLRSWGRLPAKKIVSWKRHMCDAVFTSNRISQRSIRNCSAAQGHGDNEDLVRTLPLIGIMAASSTRKTPHPSTRNLALFQYLLPSVVRSLDCGFRYTFIIGYDIGDPFYDNEDGMMSVYKWFDSNVKEPLARNGIPITLVAHGVENPIKKPGPVFLAMARQLYTTVNPDYYYRVNDDTEMLANWPSLFVNALRSIGPPFGVVGPFCEQGNTEILTHDFVHRTHMEVFEMNYYPPELVDWWMDDWISFVYGRLRTFKARAVPVIHHTGAHGQRYAVDQANKKQLPRLVAEGRKKIRSWILKHYSGDDKSGKRRDLVLKAFDADVYANFVHSNIPGSK